MSVLALWDSLDLLTTVLPVGSSGLLLLVFVAFVVVAAGRAADG